MRLAPLFVALLVLPSSKALKAMCRETREEEQAARVHGVDK
jgi:hypothetical protein